MVTGRREFAALAGPGDQAWSVSRRRLAAGKKGV